MHFKIRGTLCFGILLYWQSSQGGRTTKTALCSAVLSFGYQLLTFLDCRKVFILQVTVPAEDCCPELPVPALLPDVTQPANSILWVFLCPLQCVSAGKVYARFFSSLCNSIFYNAIEDYPFASHEGSVCLN